jgi:hypothetical protein
MNPNRREFLRLSGVLARQAGGAGDCRHLGQPERLSRGRSGRFPWHLNALLPSVALERMTIERFMSAQAEAAAVRGIFGRLKRDMHMTLGREIVYLVGLSVLDDDGDMTDATNLTDKRFLMMIRPGRCGP